MENRCYQCRKPCTKECGVCGAPFCDPKCIMAGFSHHITMCKPLIQGNEIHEKFNNFFKLNPDELPVYKGRKIMFLPGPIDGWVPPSLHPFSEEIVKNAMKELGIKKKYIWHYCLNYDEAIRIVFRELNNQQREQIFSKLGKKK